MRATLRYYHPRALTPPHCVVRHNQVYDLAFRMAMRGCWNGEPLIGYEDDGSVQLLSGTHRRAAAELACMPVPVRVYPRRLVIRCWGRLKRWTFLMRGLL